MIKKEIRSFFYGKCDNPGCTKTVAYPLNTEVPLPGTKFCFSLDTLISYMTEKENWIIVKNEHGQVMGTFCNEHGSK